MKYVPDGIVVGIALIRSVVTTNTDERFWAIIALIGCIRCMMYQRRL